MSTKNNSCRYGCFFVSVEEHEHPEYKKKSLAVGGKSRRGVISTANYEARKFDVHSAMPTSIAFKKCPRLILVEPNFELYKKISFQIREIFKEYTDLVEPLSLDEALLDITKNKNIVLAVEIAKEIKKKIELRTGLTASAGVASGKFIAKIASDFRKPDGLIVIHPSIAEKFIEQLPIEKFFEVGMVTADKMHKLGIEKGLDLKKISKDDLVSNFGKSGIYYYNIVRNIDNHSVEPHRIRKSFSLERTKVKYSNFKQVTRSHTLCDVIKSKKCIAKTAYDLMKKVELNKLGIRLLGLGISNLETKERV